MRRLLLVNVAACALLLTQYLLGMAVNVFVVIPAKHPGANAGDYFSGAASGLGWVISSGPGWAAAHAAFGLALVVAAIAAVTLARGHGRWAVGLPVLGALAVIGAAFNGVSFVNYGHAFSSMIMAGLWALALACYVAGAIRAATGMAGTAHPEGLLSGLFVAPFGVMAYSPWVFTAVRQGAKRRSRPVAPCVDVRLVPGLAGGGEGCDVEPGRAMPDL